MQNYTPLFLKFRPQALADLVGQKYVVKTLSNAVESNRISHAYLFTGPRGTGKTSSARILAKSLNCEKGPTTTPCQTCASCTEIKQGNSSSVFEIDAASNNSVDDARLLIERAPLVAQGGRFKIYIIDECHMLTKEAFNALLKTIEEPPPNVIFVLATTEEQKVPPTIVSRCQRLIFRLINQVELLEHLKSVAAKELIKIEDTALDFIVRRSGGGLRDALGLLDQASLLASADQSVKIEDLLLLIGALDEDVLTEIGQSILERQGDAALNAVNALVQDGREPYLIAAELAKHFLNLAKASYLDTTPQSLKLIAGSPKYAEKLVGIAKGLNRTELSQIVENLDALEQTCKKSSQPILNLEVGILSLCHRLDITKLEDVVTRLSALESYVHDDAPPPVRTPKAAKPEVAPEPKPPVKRQIIEGPEPEDEPPKRAVEQVIAPPPPVIEQAAAPASPVIQSPPAMAVENTILEEEKPEILVEKTVQAITIISESKVELEEAGGEPVYDGFAGTEELDELWSNLLAELQKRSIPTFSLVSTHAFPLSLTDKELTAGVLVEHFQKMIEAKIDHIKAAVEIAAGKPLHIKIRIKAPTETKKEPAKEKKKEVSSPEPSRMSVEAAPVDAVPTNASNGLVTNGLDVNRVLLETASTAPAPGPITVKSISPSSLAKSASSVIQEAYKLFEGPGSRLITSS
jgi:DNA polymerase-3 subunit gamma/tau